MAATHYDADRYDVYGTEFLKFANASPTPFHVVHTSRMMLENAGFTALFEVDDWNGIIKPGGRYYLTRNGSSIVAFVVGKDWIPGGPVAAVGAHADSTAFQVKPRSKRSPAEGYFQIGVSPYGGGVWRSWFDRDLGLAGRVIVRTAAGKLVQKLVHIKRPLLRIPSLAIHFTREDNPDFNKEEHLLPIAGLIADSLNQPATVKDDQYRPLGSLDQRHHPRLLQLLADELAVDVSAIVDFELTLFDVQPATFGGFDNEFVLSSRIDCLAMGFPALRGLIRSVEADPNSLDGDQSIRMAMLFDNEEIGSRTGRGADSDFVPNLFRRLNALPVPKGKTGPSSVETALGQAYAKSLVLSADTAHAVHPNYSAKHEILHRPHMNGGVTIKVNSNSRYATVSTGRVILNEVAAQAGVPLQEFVIRNDSLCGSTIGPFLNALTGMQVVDIGSPQLAMHSIREMGGRKDIGYAVCLFETFFNMFGKHDFHQLSQIANQYDTDSDNSGIAVWPVL